ncbi:MAG TPA: cobalamin-binding protein [Acidobacteriaceae bacterium]|nr:cobalamin-binding protein [Acidobacteriaceae bacterium]
MRIVSFLPSATEMLFAIGLGDETVGVTFECDFPPEAQPKPKVVHSHMPSGLTPAEIDAIVRAEGAQGRSLYFADLPLLESLSPDLILLQDLCRVCAIDSPTLARDLSHLPSQPQILSLSAHTLEGVFGDIEQVGDAAGRGSEARLLTAGLRSRVNAVKRRPEPATRKKVLALEWLQPFFQGGHWIPEMISLAGADPVLARAGEKSTRLTPEQVWAADPDIIVVMPCGYHLAETIEQYRQVEFPAGWTKLRAVQAGEVYAVDGSAFFSRPGPRLVDGLELLASLFRGEPGEYVKLDASTALVVP